MEKNHHIDAYHNKFREWKENTREEIRFHYDEEAFDVIHNNDFVIFGGKFQSLEFYYLCITGSVLLAAFIVLAIFAYDSLITDPSNLVTLVMGVVISIIFIIMSVWYAFAVPKFCLVLGPEGLLYKRQRRNEFYYWTEIFNIRSFDQRVRKRPNLKKKIIFLETKENLEAERVMGKLPRLNLYLFNSNEFKLKEERRDKKATEIQGIIEKMIMEYWNSRKN